MRLKWHNLISTDWSGYEWLLAVGGRGLTACGVCETLASFVICPQCVVCLCCVFVLCVCVVCCVLCCVELRTNSGNRPLEW
jgi:hypothetical protein